MSSSSTSLITGVTRLGVDYSNVEAVTGKGGGGVSGKTANLNIFIVSSGLY